MFAFYMLAAIASVALAAAVWGGSTRAGRMLRAGVVTALAALVFMWAGGDARPGDPLQARLAAVQDAPGAAPPGARAAAARRAARENPQDLEAWRELGYAEATLGAWPRAVRAFERALQMAPDARSHVDLADALVARDGGRVSPASAALVEAALVQDPAHVRALRLRAIAAQQDDGSEAALAVWSDVLEGLGEEDGRRMVLAAEAAARLSRPSRGPGGDRDGAAPFAALMAAGETDPRAAAHMVDAMVAGLSARLTDNPNDLPGWLTLARAQALRGAWSDAAAALDGATDVAARPGHRIIIAAAANHILQLAQEAAAAPPAREEGS